MSSAKWRLFCLGLNELTNLVPVTHVPKDPFFHIIACHLFDTKPLPEPMLIYINPVAICIEIGVNYCKLQL